MSVYYIVSHHLDVSPFPFAHYQNDDAVGTHSPRNSMCASNSKF